jgi:hypothetical protein
MPSSGRNRTSKKASQSRDDRDFLQVRARPKQSTASVPARSTMSSRRDHVQWPPVPDLFDVITYFRARGDSFTLIASIGFWVGDDPTRALTARGLKLWYESELERRSAAKAAIR